MSNAEAGLSKGTFEATMFSAGITVNDLDASIRFYEALGFGVEHRWENEGRLLGVMVRAGDARLGISQDDFAKGRDRAKGVGMRFWLGTKQDIHALAADAKAAGITLDTEPEEQEWGTTAFTLTDPDGFKMTISSEPEAPPA